MLVAAWAQPGGLLGVPTGGKAEPGPKQPAATGPTRKDFEKPSAPKDGPPPFLTEATDWHPETYRKFDASLFYPTQTKVEKPFYDLPFAVNIPFEVPFEGGVTHVWFDVNLVWDQPEQKARIGGNELFPGGGVNVHQQGIYRLGGGFVPPESVEWEIDSKSSVKFTAPADAPFPLLLNGDVPSAANRYSVTTSVAINSTVVTAQPRRPFNDPTGQRAMHGLGRPLVLRAVPAGWYALWFAMNVNVAQWPPEKLRADDTLRGKIYVHYIVARRERTKEFDGYFSGNDHDYIWEGRDVRPTRPIDPKLVRAYSVELPLILRRDGWVLNRVEVSRDEDRYRDMSLADAKPDHTSATVIKGTAKANANGVVAKYEHSNFHREDRNAPWPTRPENMTTFTWDLTLPPEIPDGGVGEIVAKGTVKEQGFEQTFWQRAKAAQLYGEYPTWIGSPGRSSSKLDKLGLSARVPRVPDRREDYVPSWAEKLGDPNATKYFPQPRDWLPPEKEEQPKRYFVYAETFSSASWFTRDVERTKLFYQDLGPQPVVSIGFGPWTADGYYRRKKDIEKDVSGVPAGGPTKLIEEKDPFWKWYPTFSRLLNQKLLEASTLEAQIALIREPLQEQRRLARRLLDAVQSADEAQGWSDWAFGSSDTRASFSETALLHMLQRAGAANTLAQNLRQAASQFAGNVRAAYQSILSEIDRVYDTYIDQHPELVLWRRHYRILVEQVELKVAVATSDMGLFQAAVQKAQAESLTPDVLVMQAQLQLENGDPVGALEALRMAARQQVGSTDAADRLRDLECSFIKAALEKSHGAIGDARRHFHTYLKERGMSGEKHAWVGGVHNPLSALDTESAWAVFTTGVTGSVSALLGRADEEARALDAVERDMTTAYLGAQAILRLRMRKHELVAIKAMTTERLREALMEGVTNAPPVDAAGARHLALAIHSAFQLPELAAMIADDFVALRAGLAKGYWDSKMVGNTWAEWVGDMTSPKNLVMTLLPMSIGRVGGQLQGVSYWTRAEAQLVQAAAREGYVDTGTMVVARMAGWDRALGAFGATPAGEELIHLLERSQKYQESLGLFGQAGWTVGKVVATMGLQGIAVHQAEKLGGPQAALLVEALLLFGGDTDLLCKFLDGARIPRQAAIAAVNRHFLPGAERQLHDIGRVRGAIPEVRQVLLEMKAGKPVPVARRRPLTQPVEGIPPTGSGTKPATVAGGANTNPVAGARPTGSGTQPPGRGPIPGADTNPVAGARPTGSGTQPPGSGGIRGSDTNAVAGARPTGSGTQPPGSGAGDSLSGAITDGRMPGPPTDSRSAIPNGQAGNDSSIAVVAAEEGIEQGTDNGAITAAQALENDVVQEGVALEKKIQEVRSITAKIESAPHTGPVPPREVGGTGKFASVNEGGYRLPGQPQGNDVWLAAERALHEGRYGEAEELFRELRKAYIRDANAGKPLAGRDLHIDIIEARIQQARELQTMPAPQPNHAANDLIMQPIDDGAVDSILAMPRTKLGHQGVSGEVARTNGAPFVVKRVELGGRLTGTPEELAAVIEAEVISAEVRQAFGIATPGTHVKAQWRTTPDGHVEMVSAQLIYRRVPGTALDQITPTELFHLRDQLAEDRVVAILIGDFDRKPDNYKVVAGVVEALDGGVADPRGVRSIAAGSITHPGFISGGNGRDHWYFKGYNLLFNGNAAERAAGRQMFLAEMSLTYQGAERAVRRVEALLGNATQREAFLNRLRGAYRRLHRDNPRFAPREGVPADRIEQILNEHVNGLADEALKAIEARLAPTKEALKGLNNRNGIPLPNGVGRWRPGGLISEPVDFLLHFTAQRLAA